MGFFSKIKDKLGIGGVSVKLEIPAQVSKEAGQVEGSVILTTKSEQEVIDIKITLKEEFTSGRGDDKKTKEFELGVVQFNDTFTIKPGETKGIPFILHFQTLKSSADELKEKGGALGTLGSLSKFASNEQSRYFIEADVDVKAAVLDPSDKKDIKMV